MPLYTYECSEHGEFDAMRIMADRAFCLCPVCHRKSIQVISPVAINRKSKIGQTREELFKNLGSEGLAPPDMWKYDKDCNEESNGSSRHTHR